MNSLSDEMGKSSGLDPWWARAVTLPMWLVGMMWLVLSALLVVILMRVVAWDEIEVFAIANALTAIIYLPAWFIALLGFVSRKNLLGLVALTVVFAQLVFMAPEIRAAEPLPPWAPRAQKFVLFDANVYNENGSIQGYARQIEGLKPSLVTLEEATPTKILALEKSGSLRALPHRYSVLRFDPFAFFIASAFPLSDIRVVSRFGRPLVVEATVHLRGNAIRLWVVHTTAPLGAAFEEWRDQLRSIGVEAGRQGVGKLLVVGDFNATWGNRGFREILSEGLTDGAAARARPFDMTWSQLLWPVPPLVRIDHVLTGPGLAVGRIATGDGPGSDHRDVRAQILVRPTRP